MSNEFMESIVGRYVNTHLIGVGAKPINLHKLVSCIIEEVKNSDEVYQHFAERFRRENHIIQPHHDGQIWGWVGQITETPPKRGSVDK